MTFAITAGCGGREDGDKLSELEQNVEPAPADTPEDCALWAPGCKFKDTEFRDEASCKASGLPCYLGGSNCGVTVWCADSYTGPDPTLLPSEPIYCGGESGDCKPGLTCYKQTAAPCGDGP